VTSPERRSRGDRAGRARGLRPRGRFGHSRRARRRRLLSSLLVAASWRRLVLLDEAAAVPARELEGLRSIDLFAPLPANTVEQLARGAQAITYARGTRVVCERHARDRISVVASGELEVTRDGRRVAVLGPRDYFGEIALLRDLPRTASVTARTEVELYALEREDFIATVSGNRRSSTVAEAVISARLGHKGVRRITEVLVGERIRDSGSAVRS
jgi:Cyclic nucleotide-binding domain